MLSVCGLYYELGRLHLGVWKASNGTKTVEPF